MDRLREQAPVICREGGRRVGSRPNKRGGLTFTIRRVAMEATPSEFVLMQIAKTPASGSQAPSSARRPVASWSRPACTGGRGPRRFAGATTAAIAQASGKAHGTVFVHFRTPRRAGCRTGRGNRPRHIATSGRHPQRHPRRRRGTRRVLAALARHEVLYARPLCEATTLPPAARARLFALQSGIAWRLRTAYARDVVRGAARDLDPAALANTWIALTQSLPHEPRCVRALDASVTAARGASSRRNGSEIIQS